MADRYQHPDAVGARDHQGHQRAVESDPLAELARLIGQTEPNANVGRSRATPLPQAQPRYEDHHRVQYQHQGQPADEEPAPPAWMRTAASAGWQEPVPSTRPATHEQGHYPAEAQAHEHQDYAAQEYADTPAFLRTAREHDPSRYDDVLYDQNSQNAHQHYAEAPYQDGYQDQSDPNAYSPYYADALQDEPKRRRGGLTTVLAVLALAVVGTAGAYAYRSFSGAPQSGEPPVIKAEPGANKIVPPTQTSDASGKIIDRIGAAANGQERVLSREEQPMDINGRNAPRVVFPPLNQNPGQPALATVTQTAPPAQQAQPSGALTDEPKRVRTMTIRPDQPDAVPSGSASAPAPQRSVTSARAQAPAPTGNSPVSLSPQSAPVRTAAAAPSNAAGGGGYMVQVTSQRSEADAQASFRSLQSKYPDVLGSRSASIRRADLGERGIYYRAMVGPFAAAEDAGQLCSNLRSAGGQCVVQRN